VVQRQVDVVNLFIEL